MNKIFYPKEYVSSIFSIGYERLMQKGIKGIIFDIDNTLVPFDEEHPTPEIMQLIALLKERGFKIVLLSNNTQLRVEKFNEHLQLKAIHKAKKPRRGNINTAVASMNLLHNEVAIVGDQVFTDVLGGNRADVYTILVEPVSEKDEWMTKVKRGAERQIIKSYIKYRKRLEKKELAS